MEISGSFHIRETEVEAVGSSEEERQDEDSWQQHVRGDAAGN